MIAFNTAVDVSSSYKKAINLHKINLEKIQHQGFTYIIVLVQLTGKNFIGLSKCVDCQLFFIQSPDGRRALAYTTKTKGFQLFRGLHPEVDEYLYLQDIITLEARKYQIKIYSNESTDNSKWRFKFNDTHIMDKFISLLFQLKQSEIIRQNASRLRSRLIEERFSLPSNVSRVIEARRSEGHHSRHRNNNQQNQNLIRQRNISVSDNVSRLREEYIMLRMRQEIQQLKDELERYKSFSLFRTGLFGQQLNRLLYLKKAIKQQTGRQVVKTKHLLSDYSQDKRITFDNPNMLIVIKTSKDLLLAVFSQFPDQRSDTRNHNTSIISITNQIIYSLVSEKNSIKLQSSSLVFGDCAMMLKMNEMSLIISENILRAISSGQRGDHGALGDRTPIAGFQVYQTIFNLQY